MSIARTHAVALNGTQGVDSQAIDAGARAQKAAVGSVPFGLVVPGIPVTGSFLLPWQKVQRSKGVPIPT